MLEAKAIAISDLVMTWWVTTWLHPWLWVEVGFFLFAITLLGSRPIEVPNKEESSALTVIAVRLRQSLWISFAVSSFALPVVVAVIGCLMFKPSEVLNILAQAFFESAAVWWEIPAAAWLAALALILFYRRFVIAWWSAFKRRWRVRQSGEELSDIRVEKERLSAKRFLPREYYRPGRMFLGLDEDGNPIDMPDDEWRSMHTKIIGPTQVGKGVLLGVVVDQIIEKGWTCFVIDPKPDKHLKQIMKEACKRTGRRFRELDLNDGRLHRWAPFAGGTERDRRSRLLAAFGLDDTGEQADFYKAGERSLVDRLLPRWSGDLSALRNLIVTGGLEDKMARTLSYVNEWLAVPTFSPPKGRGFTIEKALREKDVVWVRGSLTDKLIIKAATYFIMEVVQEAQRLYPHQRSGHVTLLVDEVKFMISETLSNALATVAGVDMNMILTYQSLMDLRSLQDRKLNAKAIEDSVNVNCKLTLCYQAVNNETAEWAAEMSGTIQKSVTRMETVKVGRGGVEEWEPGRMVARQEVALISENLVRTLPARVGVFFRPEHLATLLYTAWVPVTMPSLEEEVRELPAAKVTATPSVEEVTETSAAAPKGTKSSRSKRSRKPQMAEPEAEDESQVTTKSPHEDDDIDLAAMVENKELGTLDDV